MAGFRQSYKSNDALTKSARQSNRSVREFHKSLETCLNEQLGASFSAIPARGIHSKKEVRGQIAEVGTLDFYLCNLTSNLYNRPEDLWISN